MRHVLRALIQSPGFSLAVILTLALGIGANTAVFSVLRGVLLRPLPNEGGDRLVYLKQSATGTGQQDIWFSVPEIVDIRSQARSLAAVAEYSSLTFNLIGHGACLDELKQHDEAFKYFDRAVLLDPNSSFPADYMGWHYVQTGDYAAAREWFERSLRLEWKENIMAKTYLQICEDRLRENASGTPALP